MTTGLRFAIVALSLATGCFAQEELTVHIKGSRTGEQAEKIYLSSCLAVQREFGTNRTVRPRVTVVVGADKNRVMFDDREIRLIKWDRHLFAEGVVVFAFEDLMPVEQRLTLAKRAVNWADATVEIGRLEK